MSVTTVPCAPGRQRTRATLCLVTAGLAAACSRPPAAPPGTTRLVDVFDRKLVSGGSTAAAPALPRTEWRFDGPGAALQGWEAGPGVEGLQVRDGRLVGRSTTDFPILHLERVAGLDNPDQLHSIEVRLRVSAGARLGLVLRTMPAIDLATEPARGASVPWPFQSVLAPGGETKTVTIAAPAPVTGSRVRHVLLRPTDTAGATFEIESVRLVFRREVLAGTASGVGWQGLRDVFRETIVTRTPETARFAVTVPARPLLDLSVGTPENGAVTFRVAVERAGRESVVLTHTVTTAYRWERRSVDLGAFAGEAVTLALSATADRPGTLAFWGAPAVRQRAAEAKAPQLVVLVQGDTLRPDHLDAYGYERATAPTLKRLAQQGALFRNAYSQTGWTKASAPSVLTSLYPTTHGVHKFSDRLPSSAVTIAEAYRQAGYATASFSSVVFTGAFSNLHQGFEELHELESAAGRTGPEGAKTAREYVDRAIEWVEAHRDVPSFVFLHFMDPHSPYVPNPPYDTTWADPAQRDEYVRQQKELKKAIANPTMATRGMATRDELKKAGVDPEWYLRYSKDWYDGSILGMDREIGRLVERVEGIGLAERTLLAFYSDHGEEFHEHGQMFHGQGVYGEMIRVPLILWGPGRVPPATDLKEAAQMVDVMPTLLELSGIALPRAMQGRSLQPLLAPGGRPWEPRPAFAEKQPNGAQDDRGATETYAVTDSRFKLIRNVVREDGKPEFELYDVQADPFDQRDLAASNPGEVARLTKVLDAWQRAARAARLKPDGEAAKDMSAEQLEHLRSLGYVQ
ncbi:MAG: sulfatase [Vicinamibacteria bacterium]